MLRIKNDPKTYLRRSNIGWNVSNVAANRSKKTRSKKDFLEAIIAPSFYVSFLPSLRKRPPGPKRT